MIEMDITSVYRERTNLKTGKPIRERLTHTECLKLIKDLNREFDKLGYSHYIQDPSNVCSTRITNIRLSDKKIDEEGYNISPHTGRRGRVLGWKNWVEVNSAINNVFNRQKLSANVSSLSGQFVIREGSESFTEDDWEDKATENIGSIMQPVMRVDAWASEGIREKKEHKTKFGTIGESGKAIITHEIDLNKIRSPDPLAYAYGLVRGERGKPMPKEKDLAPEFVRGWKEGHRKSKSGDE